MSGPRTEAGRRLLDVARFLDDDEDGEPILPYILAIEAEATSGGVTTEGLREGLRAVLRDFDRDPTEEYLDEAVRIFRAVLSTTPPASATEGHQVGTWPPLGPDGKERVGEVFTK